jgi:hypothetical protein
MDAAERIRQSFAKQGLMITLGATLGDIAPGRSRFPWSQIPQLPSSTGLFTLALSTPLRIPWQVCRDEPRGEGVGILTTEFKINLVAPAAGDRIIAGLAW